MKNHATKITNVLRENIKRPLFCLLFPGIVKKICFLIAYTERLEKEHQKVGAALVYATQYLSESEIAEVRMVLDEPSN